jgi:hypothetical protein
VDIRTFIALTTVAACLAWNAFVPLETLTQSSTTGKSVAFRFNLDSQVINETERSGEKDR